LGRAIAAGGTKGKPRADSTKYRLHPFCDILLPGKALSLRQQPTIWLSGQGES
jgi:hypothetical protein